MRSQEELDDLRVEIEERYGIKLPDPVMEPVWYGRRPTNKIDGKFAVVDQNTGNVFAVVTDIYKPILHEEVIKNVEEAAALHPEFGKPTIKISLLADGGKLSINTKFSEVEYEVKPGDKYNPTMDIRSSYDTSWKYSTTFGAYRLVCSNGLVVGTLFEKFRKRHLVSLNPELLSNTLAGGFEKFEDQSIQWRNWNNTMLTGSAYDDLWESLPYSAPEREKIEQTRSVGDGVLLLEHKGKDDLTVYDVFQAITSYNQHEVKSELRQIDLAPKITQAFEYRFR